MYLLALIAQAFAPLGKATLDSFPPKYYLGGPTDSGCIGKYLLRRSNAWSCSLTTRQSATYGVIQKFSHLVLISKKLHLELKRIKKNFHFVKAWLNSNFSLRYDKLYQFPLSLFYVENSIMI